MIEDCSKRIQQEGDDKETLIICDDLREYYKPPANANRPKAVGNMQGWGLGVGFRN